MSKEQFAALWKIEPKQSFLQLEQYFKYGDQGMVFWKRNRYNNNVPTVAKQNRFGVKRLPTDDMNMVMTHGFQNTFNQKKQEKDAYYKYLKKMTSKTIKNSFKNIPNTRGSALRDSYNQTNIFRQNNSLPRLQELDNLKKLVQKSKVFDRENPYEDVRRSVKLSHSSLGTRKEKNSQISAYFKEKKNFKC